MIRPRERRKSPRHEAVRRFARFGWWDGGSFHHTKGRLSDLSGSGAALVVETVPTQSPSVGWFCVAGRSADDWVRARVVAIAKGSKGNRQIRLEFEAPCPHHVFQAAVWEAKALVGSAKASPSESQLGDEEVVPPPPPDPPNPRRSKGKKSVRGQGSNPESLADRTSSDSRRVVEIPNWAEVRAEIRARQRSRHLPLIMVLGINIILIVAMANFATIQLQQLSAVQSLLEALNR